MVRSTTINSIAYSIPETRDTEWGTYTSDLLEALATETIHRDGGGFALTNDIDFGSNYGLNCYYVTSKTSNPSDSGVLRLANTDSISWRNDSNDDNYNLQIGSEDGLLSFNGVDILQTSISQVISNKDIDLGTASDTNRLVLSSETSTNLDSLTRKQGALYYDTTRDMILYDNGEVLSPISGTRIITQSSHGFTTLTPVFYDGTNEEWAAAQADDPNTVATWVVVDVIDTSTFVIAQNGIHKISSHGYTVDTCYFTSAASAGDVDYDPPVAGYSNPVFFVKDSDTIEIQSHYRPSQVGGITLPTYSGNRAIQSDGDGILEESSITSTELQYLDGASSNIQNQLDTLQKPITDLHNVSFTCSEDTPTTNDMKIELKQSDNSSDPTSSSPSIIPFRKYQGGSGEVDALQVTEGLSLTIPEGATLGGSNTDEIFYVYAINVSSSVYLAVSKSYYSPDIRVSTTAISSSSDNGYEIYSETTRSDVPCKCIGYFKINLSTAGDWTTAPDTIYTGDLNLKNWAISEDISYWDFKASSWQDVNQTDDSGSLVSAKIRCNGRPIQINLIPNSGSEGYIKIQASTGSTAGYFLVRLQRRPIGGSWTTIGDIRNHVEQDSSATLDNYRAVGSYCWVDTPSEGEYEYKLQHKDGSGYTHIGFECRIYAKEI